MRMLAILDGMCLRRVEKWLKQLRQLAQRTGRSERCPSGKGVTIGEASRQQPIDIQASTFSGSETTFPQSRMQFTPPSLQQLQTHK